MRWTQARPSGPIPNAAAPTEGTGISPRGRALFLQNCASCHGSDGGGNGGGAPYLLPRPANLLAARFSDERLADALWNGMAGTAMPVWRDLPPDDLRALAQYACGLHQDAAPPAPSVTLARSAAGSEAIFRQNCVSCHAADGAGNGPASHDMARIPTNFHLKQSDFARATAVLQDGVPGTAMPPWKSQLSSSQREALAAYVRSLYGKPVAPENEDHSLTAVRADGTPVDLGRVSGWKVIYFWSAACPAVSEAERTAFVPLMQRYKGRVTLFAVASNQADLSVAGRTAAARAFAARHLPFPLTFDPGHVLADRLRASMTPQTFLLNSQNRVVYQGIPDDVRAAEGTEAASPGEPTYISLALAQALANRRVSPAAVRAFGCDIAR